MNKTPRSIVTIIFVLFALGIFLSVPSAKAEPAPQIDFSIDPSSTTVNVGDIFTVDIIVDASSQEAWTADAFINFDKDYLRVVDDAGNETTEIVDGSLPADWVSLYNVANNSLGTIVYSAGMRVDCVGDPGDYSNCTKVNAPANEVFTLATIRFKAIVTTSNTSAHFTFAVPQNSKAFFELSNKTGILSDGAITVIESACNSTVNFYDANGNNQWEFDEAVAAVTDYLVFQTIDYDTTVGIVTGYLMGWTVDYTVDYICGS